MLQQGTHICRRCQHVNHADDLYCGNCGLALRSSEENQQTVGVQHLHNLEATIPASSGSQRNVRRLLFGLTLFILIGATFILGVNVGKRSGSPSLTPQPSSPKITISVVFVDAKNTSPTNTGLQLAPSDRLIIKASGTVNFNTADPENLTSPDGVKTGTGCPCAPLFGNAVDPLVPVGTLIGSIGQAGTKASTGWFVVGSNYSSIASARGQLSLLFNDWYFSDNSGRYQVTIVVEKGTTLTTLDRRAWAPQNSGTSQFLTRVVWSGSQFVAVGAGGTILTSSNGHIWTVQTSGTSQFLTRVVWSGSQFVVVGNQGTILTSPDGHVWTRQISGTLNVLQGVTWSGSQFVAIGFQGTVLLRKCFSGKSGMFQNWPLNESRNRPLSGINCSALLESQCIMTASVVIACSNSANLDCISNRVPLTRSARRAEAERRDLRRGCRFC